ncbi:MAG: hypothetical protein V3W50_00080, partial [Thermoanaerobaculia bacterium]
MPVLPQAVLLGLWLGICSALSVDSSLSWLGSYFRAQGALTEFTYLVIFVLVLGHLREREQWRRIAYVIVVTSLAVSLYAILQALRLDPISTGIAIQRVHSSLGNAIYLGAYLGMAVFVTLQELLSRIGGPAFRGEVARGEESRGQTSRKLEAGVLGATLLLQLAAIVLSQSRGPFLGMAVGLFVYLFISLVLLRTWAEHTNGAPPRLRRLSRWGVRGLLGGTLLGLGLLVVLSLPESPLAPLRKVPYLGRLATAFDLQSSTARVRLLIWQGAVDVLTAKDPLWYPDGEVDRLASLRPVIGFGPETFPLAFNRFFPAELARLSGPAASADRAHNATFESLVNEGMIGYSLWLAVYCSVFYLGLKWLGLIRTRWHRWGFGLALGVGGLSGALMPMLLTGSAVLSGVCFPGGLIAGLVLFALVSATTGERAASSCGAIGFRDGLILTALATTVAHFVEIHFGIAITATRLYFWILAAVLVAAGRQWIAEETFDMSSSREAPEGQAVRRRKKKKRKRRPAPTESRRAFPSAALIAGLVAAVVCVSLTYGFILNPGGTKDDVSSLLVSALIRAPAPRESAIFGAPFWLMLATLAAAGILAPALRTAAAGELAKNQAVEFLLASLGPLIAYSVLQAHRVIRTAHAPPSEMNMVEKVEYAGAHFSTLVWLLLAMVVLLGFVLAWRPDDLRRWIPESRHMALIPIGFLLLGSAWIVVRLNTDPVRADTLLKNAEHLNATGRPEQSLPLIRRAVQL